MFRTILKLLSASIVVSLVGCASFRKEELSSTNSLPQYMIDTKRCLMSKHAAEFLGNKFVIVIRDSIESSPNYGHKYVLDRNQRADAELRYTNKDLMELKFDLFIQVLDEDDNQIIWYIEDKEYKVNRSTLSIGQGLPVPN